VHTSEDLVRMALAEFPELAHSATDSDAGARFRGLRDPLNFLGAFAAPNRPFCCAIGWWPNPARQS
jgi:hypothetical protein